MPEKCRGFLTLRNEHCTERERELRAKRRVSDNLGKNESCISCWIRENPSHCWQKQTHIRIYILSRHAHPEWLTVSATVEYTLFQRGGSVTCNQKWGESGSKPQQTEKRFFLHSRNGQRKLINAKIRGREKKKKSKNVWRLLTSPPLPKIAFDHCGLLNAGINDSWLQLLIALTLSPWYMLAKYFSHENHLSHFYLCPKQNWETPLKDDYTLYSVFKFNPVSL